MVPIHPSSTRIGILKQLVDYGAKVTGGARGVHFCHFGGFTWTPEMSGMPVDFALVLKSLCGSSVKKKEVLDAVIDFLQAQCSGGASSDPSLALPTTKVPTVTVAAWKGMLAAARSAT